MEIETCYAGDSLKLVSIPTVILTLGKGPHTEKHDASVISHMPDWTHIHLTPGQYRDLVRTHFPNYLDTYDKLKHDDQRANFVRYVWLYARGGIVLDSKSQIKESIDRLFYSDGDLYLVPSVWSHGYYSTQFIGSRAGHPIWLEMLDSIKKAVDSPPLWARTKFLLTTATTGSQLFSQLVKNGTHTYVVLPRKLVDPCTICQDGSLNSTGGGIIETTEGPDNWEYQVFRWGYCSWWIWIVILILVVIILVMIFRRRENRR